VLEGVSRLLGEPAGAELRLWECPRKSWLFSRKLSGGLVSTQQNLADLPLSLNSLNRFCHLAQEELSILPPSPGKEFLSF
jgi:hypothetical protein